MGRLLRTVKDSPGMLVLVIVQYDQLATGFFFHGIDCVLLFNHCFEVILLPDNLAHGQGVIEGGTSLLDSGKAIEVCLEPSFRIDDLGNADVLAVDDRDSSREIEGMDRFGRRIGEQISDIGQALVVFEYLVLAVKG